MAALPVAFKYLVAQPGSAHWTGPRAQIGMPPYLGLHVSHTGDCSGSLALWSSDGPSDVGAPVADATFTQPNGSNAGTNEFKIDFVPGRYWWLVYTRVGGSGTFDITGTMADIF